MSLITLMGYIALLFVVGYVVCRCAPMAFKIFIEAATLLFILFIFGMFTTISISVTVVLGLIALIIYALYAAYQTIKDKLH